MQVQLVRIQMRVPEFGWTTQKVFHLMNFVVNGCKVATHFFSVPNDLWFAGLSDACVICIPFHSKGCSVWILLEDFPRKTENILSVKECRICLNESDLKRQMPIRPAGDNFNPNDHFQVNGLKLPIYKDALGQFVKAFYAEVLDMILLDLPGLLFFSTYTLLVLFWAEIYHQARSLPTEKLRPAYFIINGIIYFFQICIWIYMRFSKTAVAVEVAELFFSFISLGAAVGFMVYGGRLFVMLRRFPIESRGRQNKLHELLDISLKYNCLGCMGYGSWFEVIVHHLTFNLEHRVCDESLQHRGPRDKSVIVHELYVGFVTGICCTCFLIRCVMVAIAAFDKKADMHVLNHPILDFFYYMIVEILPSALVLFILRKLPPRRVSDQYHPIK
ncbi:hypothetical protein CTI12_AA101350 [Artemisia annua]|uniref:THH1/TOM1/TOM3 domain-containing protein n=1 Tax=Artemisia annua TaxID=35608 RepID=A0A2U1PX77_ARTAN|nr:hypothetical protein CTI12_AA101350 [Artemisia annua]